MKLRARAGIIFRYYKKSNDGNPLRLTKGDKSAIQNSLILQWWINFLSVMVRKKNKQNEKNMPFIAFLTI